MLCKDCLNCTTETMALAALTMLGNFVEGEEDGYIDDVIDSDVQARLVRLVLGHDNASGGSVAQLAASTLTSVLQAEIQ